MRRRAVSLAIYEIYPESDAAPYKGRATLRPLGVAADHAGRINTSSCSRRKS